MLRGFNIPENDSEFVQMTWRFKHATSQWIWIWYAYDLCWRKWRWSWLCCDILGQTLPAMIPRQRRQKILDGVVDGGESSYVSLVRSPATAPENLWWRVVEVSLNFATKLLIPWKEYGLGWASKCRVCSSGRFSPRGWLEGLISNSRGISSVGFIFFSFSRFLANK